MAATSPIDAYLASARRRGRPEAPLPEALVDAFVEARLADLDAGGR